MILDSINIKNFRRFEDLTVSLNPNLTVIVAKNGQGKSTLLDSCAVALGTYVGAFDLGKAKHIEVKDARFNAQNAHNPQEQIFNVEVSAKFNQPDIAIKRALTGPKSKTTIKDASDLTNYGKSLMNSVRQLQTVNLPVIAYYGSGRLWNNHRNTTRQSVLNNSRSMGYEDCLSSASNYKQIQQWYTKATYAAVQQKELPHLANSNLNEQIKAISSAVDNVLSPEGWSNFIYSLGHEELAMYNKGQGLLPVSMLSDGVRAMVSLTADLAWRCTKLNPHFGENAPNKTKGIVLIDELDMHLHPAWQQTVVNSLTTTFPNIQFIVTTHSPQILTTVPSSAIRIIEDNNVYLAPQGSEGAKSSRLLNRIFGVESRPQQNHNTKLLQTYSQLVYQDQYHSEQAKQALRFL